MTTLTRSTKRKLSLLQLAEVLGNVPKACRIMGYHRDTFYEMRRTFQVGGAAAELRLAGNEVSSGGFRDVWMRHSLETRYKRLMRLDQHAQGDTVSSPRPKSACSSATRWSSAAGKSRVRAPANF